MASPFADVSDAELARMVADPARGVAAFEVLYGRHANDLLAYALANFRVEAHDVAQETWLRAFKKLREGGTEMANLRGFLFTIARNRGMDPHRRKRTLALDPTFEVADAEPGYLQRRIDEEESDKRSGALRHCFDILKNQKSEHAAVVEAWLSGERPEAASKRLGIERSNFDQRKKRAITALKECVEKRQK